MKFEEIGRKRVVLTRNTTQKVKRTADTHARLYLLTFLLGMMLNFMSALRILARCPVDMPGFAPFLPPSLAITGW